MKIRLSKQARKHLDAYDNNTQGRIKKAIAKLPDGDIKRLVNHSAAYRLRVGAYRVLFKIEDNIIIVSDISPRGGAYKH